MKPKTTTWMPEPHTLTKHLILQKYLKAWFPILSNGGYKDVVLLDGFAGPGIYDDGSDGSPIIALKAALDQRTPLVARLHFHFVEKDLDRASRLRGCIEKLFVDRTRPKNLEISIHDGLDFEDAYPQIMQNHPKYAATFAFVDPFGYSVPLSALADLMQRRSAEVLMNFMFQEVNRFLTHPDQGNRMDALFGAADWRHAANEPPAKRQRAIRELYISQLKSVAGATYVRHFEMRDRRDQTCQYLFFATKNLLGLKKMKEAMWSAAPEGSYIFSDATGTEQVDMFIGSSDSLREELTKRFCGQTVRVEDIERFVVEETAFRETHYKSVLKAMELSAEPKIEVVSEGRKRGTFPNGTQVTFL